jgi:hypothetical protein
MICTAETLPGGPAKKVAAAKNAPKNSCAKWYVWWSGTSSRWTPEISSNLCSLAAYAKAARHGSCQDLPFVLLPCHEAARVLLVTRKFCAGSHFLASKKLCPAISQCVRATRNRLMHVRRIASTASEPGA